MPFQIIQGNILSSNCDAIINPTDEHFSGSGGLDEQIHKAAGPDLRLACNKLDYLPVGSAALTQGFALKNKYVIHTVAPWFGNQLDIQRLRSCYQESLELANKHEMQSVAFPLIGSGTRGFPKELVLRVAVEEIN